MRNLRNDVYEGDFCVRCLIKKNFFCYFYFMLFVSIGLKLDLNFICYNNDKY